MVTSGSPVTGELTSSDSGNFLAAGEPFVLFSQWLGEAEKSEPNDPNAMALATADADGLPDVRMVLLKGLDERGFVFYTNTESAKGNELAANPKASLLFHWKSLRRQVRIRGPVERVSEAEADAYYATRPRGSRIGAWASQQSRPLERFGIGEIPRPAHWSGYRILPVQMEFWHDRPFRLHDRLAFRRSAPEGGWSREQLYP
jgi:pyridoxamine 5'-phosphate oxidase